MDLTYGNTFSIYKVHGYRTCILIFLTYLLDLFSYSKEAFKISNDDLFHLSLFWHSGIPVSAFIHSIIPCGEPTHFKCLSKRNFKEFQNFILTMVSSNILTRKQRKNISNNHLTDFAMKFLNL